MQQSRRDAEIAGGKQRPAAFHGQSGASACHIGPAATRLSTRQKKAANWSADRRPAGRHQRHGDGPHQVMARSIPLAEEIWCGSARGGQALIALGKSFYHAFMTGAISIPPLISFSNRPTQLLPTTRAQVSLQPHQLLILGLIALVVSQPGAVRRVLVALALGRNCDRSGYCPDRGRGAIVAGNHICVLFLDAAMRSNRASIAGCCRAPADRGHKCYSLDCPHLPRNIAAACQQKRLILLDFQSEKISTEGRIASAACRPSLINRSKGRETVEKGLVAAGRWGPKLRLAKCWIALAAAIFPRWIVGCRNLTARCLKTGKTPRAGASDHHGIPRSND